jgi:hypothetical protein
MVFFSLAPQSLTGVGANVSRMLQAIVLFFLISSFLIGKRELRFPSLTSYRYISLTLYFYLTIISGLIGILMGVYLFGSYTPTSSQSFIASFLNSHSARPFFEYIILFYYIVYFAVFPMMLFKKEEDIRYFFKAFFLLFNLSLVVGIIDLIFASQYNITVTSRYLYEWYTTGPRNVGFRFHGFFGEPRDAFVVLGLGAAFYYLRSSMLNHSQSKYYYILLLVCALLTQSTSGIIGIAIFIAIYLTTQSLQPKYLMRKIVLTAFIGTVIYVGIVNSPRILWSLKELWNIKEIYTTGVVPPLLALNMNNIYPIFWIIDNLFQLNPIPLLIGTGLGSASHINNTYLAWGGLTNPNSNIIRLLSETGVIGLLVYIIAFYHPVKKLVAVFSPRIRNNIILFSLLILSLSLSHRSAANFIFLGIFFATMKVFDSNLSKKRPVSRDI